MERHVEDIRYKFYSTNAQLFRNYQSYLDVNPDSGEVGFKIEEFMKNLQSD